MDPQDAETISRARAIIRNEVVRKPFMSNWHTVCDYLVLTMESEVEQFRALYLDRKNRLLADICHWTGTVDHVPVYPREIVREALMQQASAVIMSHNHPSGDATPSSGDVKMTYRVKEACSAVDITLHDHIVIGGADAISMRSEGLL
jgi:DNA repair protein RadC